MINTPESLESYVQYVYSSLLNLKDEGVVVSRNATLVGHSGVPHQIDVYYQFERAGVLHRVAFECKFTSRPVEKSDIIEFHGKIRELNNVQGIFVSRSGYQSGAVEYAAHYGLQLLTPDQLPHLGILLAKRIESIALLSESYVGEPFWLLMEAHGNERLTGSYYAISHPAERGVIPLFFSRRDALEFHRHLPGREDFVIRGAPQHALRFIIEIAKLGGLAFLLVPAPPHENGTVEGHITMPDEVARRFYLRAPA